VSHVLRTYLSVKLCFLGFVLRFICFQCICCLSVVLVHACMCFCVNVLLGNCVCDCVSIVCCIVFSFVVLVCSSFSLLCFVFVLVNKLFSFLSCACSVFSLSLFSFRLRV
jgi:hypothetical protein